MTLSVRTELSHSYSYDSKVDAVFKITLVAEKQAEAKGFQHIIVLDTSHSMAGKKLELAKKGAQEYWSRIPTGNKVSFITFSDSVHTYPDTNLSTTLPGIKATGMTDFILRSQLPSTWPQKAAAPAGSSSSPMVTRQT